ncbi:MAG TPA: hypothetical protein VMR59_03475 [Patescibacteria group bacterium]|jgi:hypothetical protein|nr:hypothetical protein [Patescibacteria group bacterium]
MPDIFIAEPTTETAPTKTDPLIDDADFQTPVSNAQDLSPQNPVHLFSAFRKDPDGVDFSDKEPEEKIILFIRRSFITNVRWIFFGVLLLIIPLSLPLILHFFPNPLPPLSGQFYFLLTAFYYLVIATYLFIDFISWYFNISLVTDKRVIDINFSNLVYKDVAATKINLVQDVSFAQIGAIRTFFDYGDVLVQTAGTLDNFTFESSPQPENIVHIVEDLIGKHNELFG